MDLLPCQTDMTLREMEADVLECEPAEGGFDVVLSATPLYPEGGGQPSDAGTVGGLPVLALHRRDDGAVVHRLPGPVSGRVDAVVDWVRRFDHMQQHTAQHLLTATALERHGWRTVAFHLGPVRSDIELDAETLPGDALADLEDRVNERIRQALPVRLLVTDREGLARLGARSRRLPEGLEGPLRLVEIEGVDRNTCGGTHVSSTAEIQAVKLLGTERVARGTRLHFAAGGRVLREAERALERDRALTRLLTCGADEHLPAVERLLAERKALERAVKEFREARDAAAGRDLAATPGDRAAWHAPDGDAETLRRVAAAAREGRPDLVLLLTAGDREGPFLVAGPEDRVAAAGPRVAAVLEGRGGGRGNWYQGRAVRLDRRGEALDLL